MKTSFAWITALLAVFLVSGWLLIRTIMRLIQLVRSSVVLSVPLVGGQTVSLTRAGPYDLYVEGKRFSDLWV